MLIISILRRFAPTSSCLSCAGLALGAVIIAVALTLLFAALSGNANVNNCFFFIICVNSPG